MRFVVSDSCLNLAIYLSKIPRIWLGVLGGAVGFHLLRGPDQLLVESLPISQAGRGRAVGRSSRISLFSFLEIILLEVVNISLSLFAYKDMWYAVDLVKYIHVWTGGVSNLEPSKSTGKSFFFSESLVFQFFLFEAGFLKFKILRDGPRIVL